MELKRKQRKHAFLQFEIKALRELLEKLSWMQIGCGCSLRFLWVVS